MSTVISEQDIEDALESEDGYKDLIKHIEKVVVQKALIKTRGNKSAAARLIGISRSKLSWILE